MVIFLLVICVMWLINVVLEARISRATDEVMVMLRQVKATVDARVCQDLQLSVDNTP